MNRRTHRLNNLLGWEHVYKLIDENIAAGDFNVDLTDDLDRDLDRDI